MNFANCIKVSIYVILGLSSQISCTRSNSDNDTFQNVEDTSEMIRLVFEKTQTLGHLKDEKKIDEFLFNDTIVIEKDGILKSFFPEFRNFKYKLISRDEIGNYITSNIGKGMAVWQITQFNKPDTFYQIRISKISAFSTRDKNGSPIRTPKGLYAGKENWTYGYEIKALIYDVTFSNGNYNLDLVDISYGI